MKETRRKRGGPKSNSEEMTPARLVEIERFAQRIPDIWSMSEAMAHHQACRKLVIELVAALRAKRELEQTSFLE